MQFQLYHDQNLVEVYLGYGHPSHNCDSYNVCVNRYEWIDDYPQYG